MNVLRHHYETAPFLKFLRTFKFYSCLEFLLADCFIPSDVGTGATRI